MPRTRHGKIAAAMAEQTYLLFVSKPTGYELRVRGGELPSPGAVIEEEDGRMVVIKIAPSPLPGDDRRCAYSAPA